MLISDEKAFVFIHVPKTGGSSIEAALQPWALPRSDSMWASLGRPLGLPPGYRRFRFAKHGGLRDVQGRMPAALFDRYLKFGVVRNPWDRLVSEYNAAVHNPAHRRHLRVAQMAFDEYLREEAPRVLAAQHDLLADATGKIGVDRLLRFENLTEDFGRLCADLGIHAELPHLNRYEHDSYRAFYDDAARAFVAERWRADVEAFGYAF